MHLHERYLQGRYILSFVDNHVLESIALEAIEDVI